MLVVHLRNSIKQFKCCTLRSASVIKSGHAMLLAKRLKKLGYNVTVRILA